jgi:hypothetical protein
MGVAIGISELHDPGRRSTFAQKSTQNPTSADLLSHAPEAHSLRGGFIGLLLGWSLCIY